MFSPRLKKNHVTGESLILSFSHRYMLKACKHPEYMVRVEVGMADGNGMVASWRLASNNSRERLLQNIVPTSSPSKGNFEDDAFPKVEICAPVLSRVPCRT